MKMTIRNLKCHLLIAALALFFGLLLVGNPAQASNASPVQDSLVFQAYSTSWMSKQNAMDNMNDPDTIYREEIIKKRDGVYVCGKTAMNWKVFQGTYTSERAPQITVSAPDAKKVLSNAENAENPLDITFDEEKKMFTIVIGPEFEWIGPNGAKCLFFHVNGETITLILNCDTTTSTYYDGFTEIYLFDETNKRNLSDSADFVRGCKSENTVKEYTLDDATRAVSVQVLRDYEHIDQSKNTSEGYRWLGLGENYVSINGEDYVKFANSSESVGTNRSPALYLKNGLNVVQVKTDWGDPLVRNGSGIKGFQNHRKNSCVYLIDWNGEADSSRPEPSKNTAIKYVDVSRLGNGSTVPYTQYAVGKIDGKFAAVVPASAPESKGVQFKQLLVGILPEDPLAQWEIISPKPTDKDGIRFGIYQALTVEDDVNEIKIRVNGEEQSILLQRASSEITLTDLGITGVSLLDYDTGKETSFSQEKQYYAFSASSSITLNPQISKDGTCKINGKAAPATFNDNPSVIDVELTAPDGVTKKNYYLFRREANGDIAAFTIPESTKKLAKDILWAWDARTQEEKKADVYGGFWNLFKQVATEPDFDFHGTYIADPSKHSWSQATDYGSAILELVVLGENPYNYKGVNYVQKLIDMGGGGYANNIWYLLAVKAAGAEQSVIDSMSAKVQSQVLNSAYDLDINGWNLASTAPDLTPDELMFVVKYLQEAQITSGELAGAFDHPMHGSNSMTQGCLLSGLAGASMNIENLFSLTTTDDNRMVNALTVVRDAYQTEDGQFWYTLGKFPSFNKDVIIALGDIANGESFYQRYNLDVDKVKELIAKAEALDTSKADAAAVASMNDAVTSLKNSLGGADNGIAYGLGEQYYALQDAMYAVDPSLRKGYWICTIAEGDSIKQINETIKNLSPDSATIPDYKNAADILEAYENYQELGKDSKEDKTRLQGYVENYELLEKAYQLLLEEGGLDAIEKVLAAIDALKEPASLANKAEIEAAYELYNTTLNDQQKAAITNLEKLTGLRTDIENIEAAIKLIEVLPAAEQVTLSHEKQIDEAQKAYEALTDALRGEISDANKQKLTSAQARLADLKAANAVAQKIAAIGTITEANWRVQESAAAAARDSYNRLTAAQKALVTNLSTLAAAESAIASMKTESADKEAAAVIADQIAAIGEITEENWSQKETQVAAIRAAYDRLTAAQKALVSNLSALEATENAIKEHKANAAADSNVPQIIEFIQALRGKPVVSGNEAQDGPLSLTEKNDNTPTWEIWTDEWIQYVADIRGHINRLDSGLISLITNLPDLEAAEKYISQLQMDRVKGMIAALPNADTVAEYQEIAEGKAALTTEQLTAILETKAAYDHLTPEQRQEIETAAIANLEVLYAKAQTYPDSRILYLRAYLQPYVDSLAYYYGKYQREGLDRSGLASVQEALGKCDGFSDEERAVLQEMSGRVNGEAVSFPNLFSFLDGQAGQVQKDILDAGQADARIAALPDEITEENVNEVDHAITAIEQMLEQMTWSAKSYMKNQGRLGVLKALVDYYLGGEEVRQAFEAGSPELVSAEALTANQVQVNWMSYDGAASYLVLRKTTNGNWKRLAEVTELAYTDDTAKQGATYHYTIQAISKRWNGEAFSSYHTEGLSVTTPVEKLTRPSWKKVQSAGFQSIKLSWYKVSGASGYEVYRATSKNGAYRKVTTLTKVSYTDKGLTTGKTYYYKVRAYHNGDKKTYGAYSASIAGTPRLAKVTLTKAQGAKRAVQLKWKKINGATGYKVYRASSKNGTFKAIKTLKKVTAFKDTSVTPKKTYYYRVCAYQTIKGKTTTGSRSAIGKAAAK